MLRTMLLLTLVISILLTAFSIAITVRIGNLTAERIYEKNVEQMSLIDSNMEQTHKNTVSYLVQHLDSNALAPFFQKNSPHPSKKIQLIRDLQYNTRWDASFLSVIIYNGLTDEYFSTRGYAEKDNFLVNSIKNHKETPTLTPLMRELPYEAYYETKTVFTYFHFDLDSKGNVYKAVIVNVDTEALLENLATVKGIDSRAYIFDFDSEHYIDFSGKMKPVEDLNQKLYQRIAVEEKVSDSFVDSETDRMYSYLKSSYAKWVLILEESDTVVQQNKNAILQIVLQTIVILVVMSIVFIIVSAHHINQPIRHLVRELNPFVSESSEDSFIRDDLAQIADAFHRSRSEILEFEQYKSSADEILKEIYARTLLKGSSGELVEFSKLNHKEFEHLFGSPMQLVFLSLYDYSAFSRLQESTQRAFLYAIMNLSEEILYFGEDIVSVEMGQGIIAVLCFMGDQSLAHNEWQKRIQLLQQKINSTIDFSVSAYLGQPVNNRDELQISYQKALTAMEHRLLFHQGVFLTDERLQPSEKVSDYPTEEEKEILRAMNQGEFNIARAILTKVLENGAHQELTEYRSHLTRFFIVLFEEQQVGQEDSEEALLKRTQIYLKVHSLESIEDTLRYYATFETGWEVQLASTRSKHQQLIEAVKLYIEQNYTEDIALKTIAAQFKISSGYLGRLFREHEGVSVADYINDIRLKKAEELLLSSDLSVNVIMERSGFFNESSFYKLFRRVYGTTPNNYRIQHEIESITEDTDHA